MELITSNVLLNLGLITVISLLGAVVLKKYSFPAVLVYIVIGMLISPSVLNLINPTLLSYDSIITQVTLSIIAFSIGETFLIKNLKFVGKPGAILSILQAVFTTIVVAGGLLLFNTWLKLSIPSILLLGTIAAATAPASTFMVIREYKAKGPFTNFLLAAVSIDDAVGILLFDIMIVVSKLMLGKSMVNIGFSILVPVIDIVLSLGLGVVLGLLLAYSTQRIHGSSSYLIFTLGMILFATGLCTSFHLSPLLCCMALGGAFSNFSNKSTEVFSIVENFSPPIMLMFFIVSGANLDVTILPSVGWIGLATIVLRTIGKLWGTELAGKIAKLPPKFSKYLGYAMLPQAGVAIGFALSVKTAFPEFEFITTIVVANVVYSQIVGPLLAKYALFQTGEASLEN
ncbi:MAG: cation:proton antiporter [Caldisericia bacterium]|nr:cation:proton antiporter [Caldisericia bacterium]MDD4614122.1 cation:proton antiporter [Caldisericia bacterium]